MKETVADEFDDKYSEHVMPILCQMEEFDALLLTVECAAFYVSEQKNYEKPDFALVARTLRRLHQGLIKDVGNLDEGLAPSFKTAIADNPRKGAEKMAEKIDEKYLKGLKFGYSEKEYVAKERALEPDDVLDWQDKGDCVVLVTADGQKHTVHKNKGERRETDGD